MLVFWTKLAQERHFHSKTNQIQRLRICLGTKFRLKHNFDFSDQICSKRYFQSKTAKVSITIGFSNIPINLGTKFHIKQAILFF